MICSLARLPCNGRSRTIRLLTRAARSSAVRRIALDGNYRARSGVHALPLRRSERQPGNAGRIRSHLARAQLQAMRGTHRAVGSERMRKLVVVGNGMAGMGCVEQILKHQHDFEITVFGDETQVNYNRILLSSVL